MKSLILAIALQAGVNATQICPAPIWQGTKVVWDQSADHRKNKEIGYLEKGSATAKVFAEPALERTIHEQLTQLLKTCGLQLVQNQEMARYLIAASIEEFQIGSQKKLLAQTTQAQGKLSFHITQINPAGKTMSVEINYGIGQKGLRSRKLKQIEKTASQLLRGLLEQVPEQLKGYF